MNFGTAGNVPKIQRKFESRGKDSNSNESDSVNKSTPYAEFCLKAKALIPTVTTRYFQPFASIISV